MADTLRTERELKAYRIAQWRLDPLLAVAEVWRDYWTQSGESLDEFQKDVLRDFNAHPRQAMTACKGPGKTALLALIGWLFLLTRPECRGAALSTTEATLKDTLWAELALWYSRSPLLQSMFEMTSERIAFRTMPKTWWLSARSFARSADPQAQAASLQGIHADNCLVLLDEAGGIPVSILATAEAILTGGPGKDQHIVLAGNPNDHNSALGQAVNMNAENWRVYAITGDPDDPKRAKRVSAQWAREQITLWGKDNPWVLVNVYGRFPPSALNQLISADEVRDAQKRHLIEAQYAAFPKILGVDVGRFGDDESVIFKRQGKASFSPLRMRNLDSIQGASHAAQTSLEWNADSIQIDATGGYGAAWLDQLRGLGFTTSLPVQFGGKAYDFARFANKRAEIWWRMCEWIKDGGALPPIPEMVAGLSTVTYMFTRDGRIQIEEKDQIKARLGRSPDLEDALACTFAHPVAVQAVKHTGVPMQLGQHGGGASRDYDPYERYANEIARA